MVTPRPPRVAVLALAGLLAAGAGSGTARADGGFVDGRASSAAAVVAVVPELGQARIPATVGLATAAFRARTGTAEATTAQLGLLGTILTLSICGGDPIMRPDQLPAALHTDSIGGENTQHRDLASGGMAYGGSETVSARPGAFASSEAVPAGLDLPGVLRVEGRASAEAELVPGELRRAAAAAEVPDLELAGGLVRLQELRWQADQSTGADGSVTTAAGTFTVGRLLVGGVPLPVADTSQLQAAVAAANAVLEPVLGRIVLPTTTVDSSGAVVVSPLAVRLSGGPTTATLLTPLLGGGQGGQLRQSLAEVLLFGGCQPGVKGTFLQQLGGGATTVLDVLIASLLGGGGIGIEIGGVRATSDATTVGSAFGSPLPLGDAPPVAAPAAPLSPPTTPAAVVVPAAPQPAPLASAAPAAASPSLVACITSHPAGHPGCDGGRAGLALALGTLTVAALVGGDLVRSRRRRSAP